TGPREPTTSLSLQRPIQHSVPYLPTVGTYVQRMHTDPEQTSVEPSEAEPNTKGSGTSLPGGT
ncbi:Hypothetical predicted protein, partial [Pelobates cultripes]